MKFLEKNAGARYSSIGGCEQGIPEGRLKAKEFNRHFRAQEVRTVEGGLYDTANSDCGRAGQSA